MYVTALFGGQAGVGGEEGELLRPGTEWANVFALWRLYQALGEMREERAAIPSSRFTHF